MTKKIFISTGELSADIHGGRLIQALKQEIPGIKIHGNGGDNMKTAGANLLYHISDISFMGFAEVIKHLPLIKKIFANTIAYIESENIDLVILMDYPGFNLRLAKALHKRNIDVVYYICPQIWAWHQSRVKKIKKYVKKVICILPFEPKWFTDHGVDAVYAGNPILDKPLENKTVQIDGLKEKFIGLFPGSRKQELEKHFDIMIESAKLIRKKYPNRQFVVAMAPGRNFSAYQQKYNFPWLKWAKEQNDAIIKEAEYLIMVSGTASLEAALLKTPMVIIYKTSALTYFLAKNLAKVKYIGLANLIAGEEGIHELIQQDVRPDNIAREVIYFLENKAEKDRFHQFYQKVHDKIGSPGASRKTAKIIREILE